MRIAVVAVSSAFDVLSHALESYTAKPHTEVMYYVAGYNRSIFHEVCLCFVFVFFLFVFSSVLVFHLLPLPVIYLVHYLKVQIDLLIQVVYKR